MQLIVQHFYINLIMMFKLHLVLYLLVVLVVSWLQVDIVLMNYEPRLVVDHRVQFEIKIEL